VADRPAHHRPGLSPRLWDAEMIRHHHHALALVLLLTAPVTAAAQDAMTVLNDAVKAMRLEQVKTIRYTATGSAFAIGQSFTPGGPYPRSAMTFARDFDLAGFTMRQEFVNTRVDRRGGGVPNRAGAETRQVQYASRSSGWPQQVFMWLNPPGFVTEAMKHNPTLTVERVGGRRYRVITVKVQDRYTVRGFFNDENLLDRVDTALDNNPVLGDPPLDGVFTGYKDFGGIVFPSRIVHHLGLQPSFDFAITSVTPNATVDTTPPAASGAAAAGGAVTVTSQTIGKGVHYLTGGTHHSVVVEFSDHVAVIDAPLSEARSHAVIAEVTNLAPGKPIRYLITRTIISITPTASEPTPPKARSSSPIRATPPSTGSGGRRCRSCSGTGWQNPEKRRVSRRWTGGRSSATGRGRWRPTS